MWLICTDFLEIMAIYLPNFFSRRGANGLLLLSTHYPHPAAISTRITQIWLIGTDFLEIMAIYLPNFFHAKAQRRKWVIIA